MKKLWKGALALVLLSVPVAAGAAGCVANESSLFVKSVLEPSCDAVTPDSTIILTGYLDTRYSCSYSNVLVIGNQLVKRGDDNKLQTETSRVEIKSADVQVLDPNGSVLGEFSVPADGFVDPATNTLPGTGLTEILMIDGATGKAINDAGIQFVTSRVVVRGRTLGGLDLKTAPFDFPISVCNGCLCKTPSDDTCVGSDGTPTEKCLIPQDRQFDCRLLGADCTDTGVCGVLKTP
ncbi:MAG: hypothetical protein U0441_02075 [Polyangiaceae bacterium]